jgi:hypothetical protein
MWITDTLATNGVGYPLTTRGPSPVSVAYAELSAFLGHGLIKHKDLEHPKSEFRDFRLSHGGRMVACLV